METKPWYASKTLWVGVLSALGGAITLAIEFVNNSDYTSGAIVGFIGGVIMVVLRVFTNKAIG